MPERGRLAAAATRLAVLIATLVLLGMATTTPTTMVSAHAMTKEEAIANAARQEDIYHCMPAVEAYTLARKQQQQQQQRPPPPGFGRDPSAAGTLGQSAFFQRESSPTQAQAAMLAASLASADALDLARIRNSTCVLAPEVTQGPYYHDQGHLIRRHMAEYQLGLPFIMNIGVIDVETCQPVEGVLVDVWMANATGYYSGHPQPAPHLQDERPATQGMRKGMLSAYPRTNERETWLRAAYPTDENGVVQFTSIFPGYYTGRATHVHTRVHTDWKPLSNGSYIGGPLAHVGQFFFEDDLNESIDKLHPYSLNPIRDTWGRTRNWNDGLKIFEAAQEGGYKAIFDIGFLGHVVSQGLIGYVTMGINMSSLHEASSWNPQSARPQYS